MGQSIAAGPWGRSAGRYQLPPMSASRSAGIDDNIYLYEGLGLESDI